VEDAEQLDVEDVGMVRRAGDARHAGSIDLNMMSFHNSKDRTLSTPPLIT
jgi:hypothetical protein